MTARWYRHPPAVLGAWVLVVAASSVVAQPWVVRPIGGLPPLPAFVPHNVDVMVHPSGEVAVGYGVPFATGGEVVLSTLDGALLSHQPSPTPGIFASFDMDAAGNVSYAISGGSVPLTFGQDLGAGGGLTESVHPDSGLVQPSVAMNYALDRNEIPAILTNSAGLGRFLSRLDSTSTWQTQTSADLFVGFPFALAFDGQNRPVMAHAGRVRFAVVVEDPSLGPLDISAGASMPGGGVSVAAGPNGEIAFAFIDFRRSAPSLVCTTAPPPR